MLLVHMRVTAFLYIVIIGLLSAVSGVASEDSGGNGDQLINQYSSSLEKLGLTLKDLNWGESVGGLKMAALFIKPRNPNDVAHGMVTLIISIQNISQKPVVIPLVGGRPTLYGKRWGDPNKWLFQQGIPGISMARVSTTTLDPGKMVTFETTDPIDRFDKDRLSMMIAVEFNDWGMVNIPAAGQGLELQSREVKLP